MQIGIAGFTNVGKTTFFSAATLAEAEISDRPFTTIKPNIGLSYVTRKCVCNELGVKCNPIKGNLCIKGIRFIPIKLIDVAGLIPDAHKGKGLGNQFLSDLMQADAIILVIDISGTTNYEGFHQQQRDVSKDIELLEKEIDFWIKGILEKHKQKLRKFDFENKLAFGISKILSGLKIKEEIINKALEEINEKFDNWSETELLAFASKIREFGKPMLIAANKIDMPDAEKNLQILKEKYPNKIIVPCCAEAELALRRASKSGLIRYIPGSNNFEILKGLDEKKKKALEFIKNKILSKYRSTGIQQAINKAVFELLNYIVVYPVEDINKLSDSKGNVLPEAVLLEKNATPLDLAEKIHSSLAENFIAAIDARTKKKISKDTKLKMDDIIKIVAKN